MANSPSSSIKQLACLLALIYLAAISPAPPHAEAAIACSTVLTKLSPCLPYLRNGGPAPPPGCCAGAQALNAAAATTPARQSVCNCIKTIASGVGAKPENINSIPPKCKINIPYRYSPSLDCSRIH